MWNQQGQMMSTKPANLVAALFREEVSARDAIADLKIAGVGAGQIAVALSERAKLALSKSPGGNRTPCDLQGKHSIWWKLRHSIEHDSHSRGADFSSKQDAVMAKDEMPPFTEVDLNETLLGLGVAPATVGLLDREIPAGGMLILVDAGDHGDRVESILQRNRGTSRTVMVTETGHITS